MRQLINLVVNCDKCKVHMKVIKTYDAALDFQCPECGAIEHKNSTISNRKNVITKKIPRSRDERIYSLCTHCINNKMCKSFTNAIKRERFVIKCSHYVRRSVDNQ